MNVELDAHYETPVYPTTRVKKALHIKTCVHHFSIYAVLNSHGWVLDFLQSHCTIIEITHFIELFQSIVHLSIDANL